MAYFTTHPSLEAWPDEGIMTLGIGTLCEHGECVVLASEKRATYGASPVAPNDQCGKQFDLNPLNCFVSIAGSNSTCHAVFSQFAHELRRIEKKSVIPPELLMKVLDKARGRELRRLYDWELQRSMGISLSQWACGRIPRGKMNELILKAGLSFMEHTPFKVELIVSGFIGEHTMFFRASQKGRLEEESSPGVYAIGSGQIAAMNSLNRRGQNVHMSLARTLLHVYEAMHIAQSKTVGPPPDYVIVMKKRVDQVLQFPTAFLETWRKSYDSRPNTASLDDSKVASTDVLARLEVMIRKENEEL